jgi:sulfite exporter TauE/SafE
MIITISAAFIMGIAGSLHCLGMCGPLVTALETMATPNRWRYSQWLHHGGRWLTYAALGAIAGALGQTFAAIGFQRWTVILAGILMLLIAFIPTLGHVGLKPAQRITSAVKKQFSKMMHAQHPVFRLLLGILHGLLPCGLVYTAMATAMATTSIAQGTLFMFIFGIATTPALIAVSRVMHWLKQYFHMRSIKHIQGALMILALLVILRGSNLGIPMLSPKVNASKAQMECCHR